MADKNSPNGYKINNIRYYDNIRIVTNKKDTELITVAEDKNNKALKNVKDNKWEEVK